MNDNEITKAQIKAARNGLGWDFHKMAEKSGVARRTAQRAEDEEHPPVTPASKRLIIAALEKAGVTFRYGRKAVKIPTEPKRA